jgi:hypothetical protein
MENIVMVNGRAYSAPDVKLQMFGRLVLGWTAISYKKKQNKTNNYGGGKYATSRGYGIEEYEASITLEMKEVERLTASAAAGSILDLPPTDIVISFINEANLLVTHTLRYAEFLENGRTIESGSTNLLVELPLVIAGINGL